MRHNWTETLVGALVLLGAAGFLAYLLSVGQVEKVSLDPKTYFAITDLALDANIVLPSDSTAKVTSDGLLGGALISIEPGGSETNLKPGSQIENTQGAVDLFGLIGQFINKPTAEPAAATDLP